METVIAEHAAVGIINLFQLGAVVTVLVLVILGGYVLFKRAIEQCERREDRAIQNWEKANERHILFFDNMAAKSNEAFNKLENAVTRLEVKLDAR
jgi:hypothetical protein